ncbi:MAG: glucose PTS transporter subunit IIA [Wujia sp.]
MKDKIFGVLQRVGRSFMLPIALLPVAGLLLGLGSSFTNEATLATYNLTGILGKGTVLNTVFTVMAEAGNVVFANLPVLFAMGVAIGMAKQEKDVAALSAVVAFLIMHASIHAMIVINGGVENMLSGSVADVLGIQSLQMGVFGGIIVGLGVAALHNRFYKIELPQVLSFFGGTRFVPIISSLVFTLVGIVLFFVWPVVQSGIYMVGELVMKSGYAGTWIYGFMERLLIPFGLHHVFYLPFWQTAVGGTMVVAGKLIEGAQNIFFAQLADPTVTSFSVEATRFMSGKFPLMIFGLPGAALAMYKTAKQEKKKVVSGLLLSAALTSMITGITEPLEFTFLFVAPGLYAIHCVFAGFAYMLMHVFRVGVGMTFSGGLIDLFLFGILQGNAKTNWIWVVIVGVFYFAIYYFVFAFLIRKLNLKTPGRENTEEVKLYRRSDMDERKKQNQGQEEDGDTEDKDALSAQILDGLGGRENVSDVDCCATRLRCTVHDGSKVKQDVLKATGAVGVICKGEGVQVIYGPRVSVIKSDLCEYMDTHTDDHTDRRENHRTDEHMKEHMKKQMDAESDTRTDMHIQHQLLIKSPVTGYTDVIGTAPDEAFASGMMGDGMVVEPKTSDVVAPADATVSFVFPTKHAIGLVTEDGTELLLHMGIDTVKLDGMGFEVFVKDGDRVKVGEKLMRLDLDYIREHAPSLVSPVICTSMSDKQRIHIIRTGEIKAGDDLYVIETLA